MTNVLLKGMGDSMDSLKESFSKSELVSLGILIFIQAYIVFDSVFTGTLVPNWFSYMRVIKSFGGEFENTALKALVLLSGYFWPAFILSILSFFKIKADKMKKMPKYPLVN